MSELERIFAFIRVHLRLSGLALGDGLIGDVQELRAAAAHLDGDVAQGRALELETGRLAMIRTAYGFELAGRIGFKFLY